MHHPASLEKINSLLAGSQPITWIMAGDSITHGALHTFGHRDYTEHFCERLRYEMGRKLDHVIKTGISGWKVTDILRQIDRVLLAYPAQVVSINIGMNDAKLGNSPAELQTFESAYRQVLDTLHARLNHPALVLHTPQPILHDGTPRLDTLPSLTPIIRSLANEYGAVLVDHDADWRAYQFTYWLSDPIHPNYLGHRRMAHTLLKALGLFDIEKSLVCKLDVPAMPR